MTAELAAKNSNGEENSFPLRTLLHDHLREVIISFGAATLNAVGFYIVLTYLPTYLTDTVHMSSSSASIATTTALIAYVAMVFAMGHLSETIGRK